MCDAFSCAENYSFQLVTQVKTMHRKSFTIPSNIIAPQNTRCSPDVLLGELQSHRRITSAMLTTKIYFLLFFKVVCKEMPY